MLTVFKIATCDPFLSTCESMAFLHHLIVDFVIKLVSSARFILNEMCTQKPLNAIYLSIILAWRDLFLSLLIKT